MGKYDNLTFGATAWSLKLFGPNDVASFREVAPTIKVLPFYSGEKRASSIEVFASMDEDGHDENLGVAKVIRIIAKDLGLKVYACGFNPNVYPDGSEMVHLTDENPTVRRTAIKRIQRGLEYAAAVAEFGQGMLTGPWQMRHKHIKPCAGDVDLLVSILKNEVAPYAETLGVRAAFEPLQMDEGYLPNPGYEAIEVVERVDSERIGINGDTKHLAFGRCRNDELGGLIPNIERLVKSGKLFDFHLSELSREQWGSGDIGVRTKEIVDTLVNNGYRGSVNLENFCPDLYGIVGISKIKPDDPLMVLNDGARYIRNALNL